MILPTEILYGGMGIISAFGLRRIGVELLCGDAVDYEYVQGSVGTIHGLRVRVNVVHCNARSECLSKFTRRLPSLMPLLAQAGLLTSFAIGIFRAVSHRMFDAHGLSLSCV